MYNYYAEQLFRSIADQVAKVVASPDARLLFMVGDIVSDDALLLLNKCSNLCHTKNPDL